MSDAWGAILGGGVGVVTGLAVPWVIRRLPEPHPEPEPVPVDGEELTAAQKARLAEGPKEPYVELGARPRLALLSAVLSGVAGALIGWTTGVEWLLLLLFPVAPVGTLLAIVDLRTRLLPRVVVIPVTVAALAYGVVAWPVTGDADPLVRALIGMALAFTVFFLLWFIHSAGMGYGDVRLSAWLGFVLGYLGWAEYALGMYAGFLILGLPGLLLALVRRDRSLLRKAYPFGPFLIVGALLGILFGQPLLGDLALG
jgi:leader peptidase (prepilin peptidase) / N-methyltransferase